MSNRVDEFIRRATKPDSENNAEEAENVHMMKRIQKGMSEPERREVDRIVKEADLGK